MFLSKNNKVNFKVTVASLVLVSTVIFFIPLISSAQILVPQVANLGTADIKTMAGTLIQVFLGLLGLIALVIIIYGGYVWMTSGGNEEKVTQAKKILTSAVIGIIIIMTSYVITSFILESVQNNSGNNGSNNPNGNNISTGLGSGALGGGLIEYHYPERDADDVPRNTMIMITFKTPIALESVIDGNFGNDATCDPYITEEGIECGKLSEKIQILDNGFLRDNEMIIAVLTADAQRVLIKPIEALGNEDSNTNTTIRLASDMESVEGQTLFPGLENGYSWQFEISTFLDLTPPEVTFVWPAQDDIVARNAIVQINFSEPINILSVDGNILIQDDDNLTGELKISNQYRTVEFLSDGDCGGVNINSCGEKVFCLPATSLIRGVVDNIGDASGNIMSEEYLWTFSTSNEVNTTAPEITNVSPSTINVQINPNPQISAIFDKVISPSSLNTDNFYIYNNSACDGEEYEDQEGKSRINNICLPSYSVFANEDNHRCNIKLYAPYLDQFSNYRPRLTSEIKDSYGNCFNSAIGPGGSGQQN